MDSTAVADIMEMIAVVMLPFAAYAAAITLVFLIVILLISAFWRLIFGVSE